MFWKQKVSMSFSNHRNANQTKYIRMSLRDRLTQIGQKMVFYDQIIYTLFQTLHPRRWAQTMQRLNGLNVHHTTVRAGIATKTQVENRPQIRVS
jgi:hypothetical protein